MNDDMIKQQIRKAFEPMFTEVVELEVKVISNLTKNFPADMSEEQCVDLVKGILKSQGDVLASSIKNSIPADFDVKVKEAVNGRRS